MTKRLEACKGGAAALEEWIDYRTLRMRCCELGLDDYMNKIDMEKISPENIVPIFQKRFFNLWLDSVLKEFPSVANFRHKIQDKLLEEFCELDKMQFKIARLRIRSKLINRLPSMNHFTTGLDEVGILKRELGKKKRIMPLRRLFRQIPNLILTLKPCLMMSPLSVSMFLESDSFVFDTVIFDEASQVCTENAIGAIFRGKQVIIAGDSKQLPPTNFFTAAATSDNDFDSDGDSDGETDDGNFYESVLDEAVLLPERTLLWHYRSRHEHLIAYSNARIYKNRLVTFPSNVEKKADIGVEYIYVEKGRYDRGGRKGNVIEAAKVADLIFEHFRKFPDRSLGVITFGEVQQQAIDTEVRKRRMKNPEFERFFNEECQEPFFIKSLENVQGDERDTIIFSIGYAKDSEGVMRMQFGPLGLFGGERRLNVAITRGKYNVKLVGSILPGDIDVNRISSEGPKLLRGYIDFAINGPSILEREEKTDRTEAKDPTFEKAVCRFLEGEGYNIATNVGCSDYRIDIAVRHPVLNGQYVLGIECDGDSYHSSKTARERDRLRRDMLETMGWNTYHIWSADWIKDPVAEGKRLVDAIEAALSGYNNKQIKNSEIPFEEIQQSLIKEEIITEDVSENPYGFKELKITQFDKATSTAIREDKVKTGIFQVIQREYPIHFDMICQRVCPLFGREKVSSVVQTEVERILSVQTRMRQILCKDKFYFPADYKEIPIRQANGRSIKYISIEELASGMFRIAKTYIGCSPEMLINETIRAFGFTRKGANITAAMKEAYILLKNDRKIDEAEGKVAVR